MNASQSLTPERIEDVDYELLQVRQDLKLDSEADSRVQSFLNLDAGQKSSILASLNAGEDQKAHAEWGFLKNIINIDCFF